MKRLFFLAFITITAASCDIVELPIEEPEAVTGCVKCPEIDTAELNVATRKVMVEEFTGHSCTGCPAQTDQLLNLQTAEAPEVIVVSYHAGGFAEVDLPDYPTDFRTEYGDAVHENIQNDILAYPSAMVNRETFADFGNTYIFLAHNEWKDPILNSVGDATSNIALGVAADYSTKDNKFYVRVSTKTLADITEEYRLVVLCIEDEVIAEQKDGRLSEDDYPHKINKEYSHRHVLRDQLRSSTGVSGEIIISATDGLEAEQWIDWSHEYTPADNIVNPENCLFVAYVLNAATGTVMQVEEAHVHVE